MAAKGGLLCGVLAAFPTANAAAYEPIEVTNGGALHGVVKLEGKPPAPTLVRIDRDETVCGKQSPDESIVVGKDGGLANVVVALADIETGRAIDLTHTQRLDNLHCQFVPHVQSLSVGQALLIRNSDPILHNTHAHVLDGTGNVFNIALPLQGKEIRKVLKNPGVQHLKCDAGHTWMNAYFLVFEHPYHAVTDTDGKFALAGIRPGTYTLRTWHEVLGRSEVTVKVEAGRDVEVPAIVLQKK